MNRLYLVRHGENRANITKEFSYKKIDYSLTDKGVLQAQQTAAHFVDKQIHQIYSSPLKRAVQTAGIIATKTNLEVVVIENFREVNVGSLDGQPGTSENWENYNRVTGDWLTGKPESAFPGGEDYFALWARARTGIERIVGSKSDRNIIIVGHGGIFTYILQDLCRNVDGNWLSRQVSHNCSITEVLVDWRNGHLTGDLVTWAASDHLSGPAANFVTGTLQHRKK